MEALALRDRAEHHLRELVGDPDATLREDQWTAIEALVADHRRALVVQRTGWGKSAVYFVATALLRAAGAGPTVIISPLLALMRNQIAAAGRAGIRAVTINSANAEQWSDVHRQIRAGEVDVLLVSPERLNNPGFRDEVLPRLAETVGMVVIDEAHCISDWGHDFRPDYRRIRTLLADLPAGIPVLATTATANGRVTADVAEQLAGGAAAQLSVANLGSSESARRSGIGVGGGVSVDDEAGGGAGDGAGDGADADAGADDEAEAAGDSRVLVLRGSLDRQSLHLGVVNLPDQPSRLAWLTEHLPTLPGSGIIYCLTVAATEQVADHLRANGFEVAAYSGRTEQAERLRAEDDLLAGRVKALVATSALGMGFDKPDLGFVIHLGAPASPIAYYQQVGRAGRGVDRATVLLLPGREDQDVWNYFGSLAFPAERDVRATLAELAAADRPLSVPALEPLVSLRRARLEMMLKVLDVDGAVRRVAGGWTATGEAWHYDADRYRRVAQARAAEQQAMLDYIAGDRCRMQFLRLALDDDAAEPCGRCDVCGGLSISAAVDQEAVATARSRLEVPGEPVQPRAQWPSAMPTIGIDLRGKIGDGERAEPGRAVGRLDSIGWGTALRELFAATTADGEVPIPLRRAAAQVLDAWWGTPGSRADSRPDSVGPHPGTRLGPDRGTAHGTAAGTAAGSVPDPASGTWSDSPSASVRDSTSAPPDGIVGIGSTSRPQLLAHLTTGLGRYLRLPLLTTITSAGPGGSGGGGVNSAWRLHDVLGRLSLVDPAAVDGRRILLVDDLTDSGWTLAVAARALRLAGATAVYPFVLGVR